MHNTGASFTSQPVNEQWNNNRADMMKDQQRLEVTQHQYNKLCKT